MLSPSLSSRYNIMFYVLHVAFFSSLFKRDEKYQVPDKLYINNIESFDIDIDPCAKL